MVGDSHQGFTKGCLVGKQAHEKGSLVIWILKSCFNSRLGFEYDITKDTSHTLGTSSAGINCCELTESVMLGQLHVSCPALVCPLNSLMPSDGLFAFSWVLLALFVPWFVLPMKTATCFKEEIPLTLALQGTVQHRPDLAWGLSALLMLVIL